VAVAGAFEECEESWFVADLLPVLRAEINDLVALGEQHSEGAFASGRVGGALRVQV
jgi:hypothetical protein